MHLFWAKPSYLVFIPGCTEFQISTKLNLDVNINSFGKEILNKNTDDTEIDLLSFFMSEMIREIKTPQKNWHFLKVLLEHEDTVANATISDIWYNKNKYVGLTRLSGYLNFINETYSNMYSMVDEVGNYQTWFFYKQEIIHARDIHQTREVMWSWWDKNSEG